MKTTKVNATLTTGNDNQNLTLRIFLTKEQREEFLIEKGKQPQMFSIIVMEGGDSQWVSQ